MNDRKFEHKEYGYELTGMDGKITDVKTLHKDDYKISDAQYLFIKCEKCGDRSKLAKNKGDWVVFDFLSEFLLNHSDCGTENIMFGWE